MLKKYALLACILALLPLVAVHASGEGSLPDLARRLLTHIDSLAVKGLLISGMLMPMMTVFNRLTTYRYDTLIKQLFLKDPTTDLDGLIGDGEEPNEEEWMVSTTIITEETSPSGLSMRRSASDSNLIYIWQNKRQ